MTLELVVLHLRKKLQALEKDYKKTQTCPAYLSR